MPSDQSAFRPIDFKTRFPALDGVRALAVSMVFLEHYGGGAHGGMVLQAMNRMRVHLVAGVDIFFVLSGFLITGILYDTQRDSHYFRRFFARRSVRIFPVVYLLFAVLALLTPVLHYYWRWKQLWFLIYLGNMFANHEPSLYSLPSGLSRYADASLSHLWSLCVEEQFYLVWPLVVWAVRDRVKLLWTSAGLCVAAFVLRLLAVLSWDPITSERWLNRSLPFKLDSLLFGAMLALLLRGPEAARVQRASRWLFLSGLAGMALVEGFNAGDGSPWFLTAGITATALMATGLIGMTLRTGSLAFRVFNTAPMRLLGRYSYGFYLYHLVWQWFWIRVLIWVGGALHSKALTGLLVLPVNFVVTFLVARLSYLLFEVRFLALKRCFEYDSELRTHRTAFAADGN